jgi:TPR repeat protein
MKRIKANDPDALREMGAKHDSDGDYESAFKFYTKAAELGNVEAHYHLSASYHNGEGVEKDEKKELYHLEEAAIGGHPSARYNLGIAEGKNGRIERSVKHFIIAASLGHDDSLKALKQLYAAGLVSKEDFAAALRAHQAAVDATKSPQREVAQKRK